MWVTDFQESEILQMIEALNFGDSIAVEVKLFEIGHIFQIANLGNFVFLETEDFYIFEEDLVEWRYR